ncbi:MAG: MerR family transcriptional regulator [Alistipes sp.]|nr:MerR family transcriptional regulator [Alistipes sp.]
MAKLLYSMGEVTEMFDVNASLIRYWESKFDCIKPHKNKKGNRMFTPSDIENLKLIYHLVKEKGMTLEGANLAMKRRGKSVKRDVSILERLQNIRAMLLEIRETLGDDSPVEYEAPIEAMAELITDVESAAKADVVEGVTTPTPEEAVAESAEPAEAVVEAEPRRRGRPRKQEANEADSEAMQSVTRRRTKSKKGEEKELFPFYEQSLF